MTFSFVSEGHQIRLVGKYIRVLIALEGTGQAMNLSCLWCYSECASTLGKLKSLPDHGRGIEPATFGYSVYQLGYEVKSVRILIYHQQHASWEMIFIFFIYFLYIFLCVFNCRLLVQTTLAWISASGHLEFRLNQLKKPNVLTRNL